ASSFPWLIAGTLIASACGDDDTGDGISDTEGIGDELTTAETGDGDPTGDGDGDPTGDGDGDPTGDGDGDGDGDPTGDGDGDGDGDGPCEMGEVVCEGGIAKVCDGQGGFSSEEPCADECSPDLGGCVTCLPGTSYCDGDMSYVCLDDGSGHTPQP